MAKLTEAQRQMLALVAHRPGVYTAWTLGTRTAEALRKRGFFEGQHPFTGRFKHDPFLYITEAGRAALTAQEPRHD